MYFVYLTKKTCAQTTANPNGSRPKKKKEFQWFQTKDVQKYSLHDQNSMMPPKKRESHSTWIRLQHVTTAEMAYSKPHTHTHNKTFHHKNCAHRLKSLCIGSANERLKSAWFIHVTEWTVISFSIVRIFSRILIENKQFFFCFIKFNVLARDWGNHICLNLATQWQRDCVKW